MIISDLGTIEGRTYPARRKTQNLVGGVAPIQTEAFSMGFVTLEPNGGQVPWHNQEQAEVYFVIEGVGEMCLGQEVAELQSGQAVFIPPKVYHQLSNKGNKPLTFVYVYGPAGDVDHWKQELAGTLPVAGEDVPPLPGGSQYPQITDPPKDGSICI